MGLKTIIGVVLLFGIGISLNSSIFVLREGRQAIVVQFGRPIGDSLTDAGIHFKTPFVQEVRFVDKRILSWDGYPNQIPTKDNKYIWVDTTARYRVTDALKFIETVQNERGARARIDAILDSTTRDVVSNHRLVETVRNTNDILNRAKHPKGTITGELETIEVGRENLSTMIADEATKKLEPFGIKLIDVQLRRIAYNKTVETKVYERMISEQNRIAERIRSVGKGEQAKIRGKISRDLQRIESEAYKSSREIEGKAEAQAIKIYAAAYTKDPKFYGFLKKLETIKKSVGEDTEMILSTESEVLDAFRSAPK